MRRLALACLLVLGIAAQARAADPSIWNDITGTKKFVACVVPEYQPYSWKERSSGEWKGFAAPNGGKCKPAIVSLTVEDNAATGQAQFANEAARINGTVRDDGSFGATIGWQPLTGKFNTDKFAGTFHSGDCDWQVLLERARK